MGVQIYGKWNGAETRNLYYMRHAKSEVKYMASAVLYLVVFSIYLFVICNINEKND